MANRPIPRNSAALLHPKPENQRSDERGHYCAAKAVGCAEQAQRPRPLSYEPVGHRRLGGDEEPGVETYCQEQDVHQVEHYEAVDHAQGQKAYAGEGNAEQHQLSGAKFVDQRPDDRTLYEALCLGQ